MELGSLIVGVLIGGPAMTAEAKETQDQTKPRDEGRTGDWIQTFTGRCFYPLDPRPEEIFIEDIAHSLSLKCRYGGHSVVHYSVAEHSVLMSLNVAPENALWALLHDAAEAYSADIPRPLKRFIKQWPGIEVKIMEAVCTKFGLALPEPEEVSHADLAICVDERAAIMAPCDQDWGELPPALGASILCLSPQEAERAFLLRFDELTKDHS